MTTSFITVQRREEAFPEHVNQFIAPINALETGAGVVTGAPSAGTFLKGTGTGTSGWAALTNAEMVAALGFTPPGLAANNTFAGRNVFDSDTAFKVGSALASAATIDLTSGPVVGNIFSVAGVATITTITPRRTGDWLLLIPSSMATWVLGVGGNIAADALANPAGSPVLLHYDGTSWRRSGTPNPLRYVAIASSAAIANSMAETAFDKTFSIPANSLAVGDVLRVRASGAFGFTGTPAITLRLKLGSVALMTLQRSLTGAAGSVWMIDAQAVVRSIGAGGTVMPGDGRSAFRQSAEVTSYGFEAGIATVAVDTTAALTAQITAQWSVSNVSNTINLHAMTLDILRPGSTS